MVRFTVQAVHHRTHCTEVAGRFISGRRSISGRKLRVMFTSSIAVYKHTLTLHHTFDNCCSLASSVPVPVCFLCPHTSLACLVFVSSLLVLLVSVRVCVLLSSLCGDWE